MPKQRPLQLVVLKRKAPKRRVRPLQVRYYRLPDTMPDFPDAYGHCRKEVGVIRGAMVRLFLGEYALARVYDMRTGLCTMTLRRRADGLPVVTFGKHVLGVAQADGTIKYGNGG